MNLFEEHNLSRSSASVFRFQHWAKSFKLCCSTTNKR